MSFHTSDPHSCSSEKFDKSYSHIHLYRHILLIKTDYTVKNVSAEIPD